MLCQIPPCCPPQEGVQAGVWEPWGVLAALYLTVSGPTRSPQPGSQQCLSQQHKPNMRLRRHRGSSSAPLRESVASNRCFPAKQTQVQPQMGSLCDPASTARVAEAPLEAPASACVDQCSALTELCEYFFCVTKRQLPQWNAYIFFVALSPVFKESRARQPSNTL